MLRWWAIWLTFVVHTKVCCAPLLPAACTYDVFLVGVILFQLLRVNV